MSRYCPTCNRAKKACLCRWIKPIKTEVELIILQHPDEEKRAKGTAKILSLSLNTCRCFVGEDFTHHSELNHLLSEPGYINVLLYPGEGAKALQSFAEEKYADNLRWRVILIDGTWRKAYKIYQLSANLHALPAVALNPESASNYRIRKAPSESSLSTVEAGYQILTALDSSTDYTPLISAFKAMIDFQIAQMPAGVYQKNYRRSIL